MKKLKYLRELVILVIIVILLIVSFLMQEEKAEFTATAERTEYEDVQPENNSTSFQAAGVANERVPVESSIKNVLIDTTRKHSMEKKQFD